MWGVAVLPVLVVFWIHVSFELQEQPTNFNVANARRPMQRSKNAEYRELTRTKQNKYSLWFFKSFEGWQSYLSLVFTSALDCKSSRQTSTSPFLQDQCRGVRPMLNTGNYNVQINRTNIRYAISKISEEWQSYSSVEFTSALNCKSSRQTSTWPLREEWCRGVWRSLNTGN